MHICVEGNIGSGKSTLCKKLAKKFSEFEIPCEILPEPVDIWQQFYDYNLLDLMYKDPKKNAYAFQNLALTSKVDQLQRYSTENILVERSIYAQKNVFIPALANQGNITEMEHLLLDYAVNVMTGIEVMQPTIYIYLKVPPIICLDRLRQRGRNEEKMVDIEYLQSIDKLYESWMRTERKAQVIVLEEPFDLNLLMLNLKFANFGLQDKEKKKEEKSKALKRKYPK